MSLRIGLGLFTGQVPPGTGRTQADEYADTLWLARVAEDVGFDAVWVSEHHGAEDGYLPSLMVLLAALAAATERLTLATGVAIAPLQHPLRFAEDCAVVDQLSRGRLVVGLGAGWRREEFRAFGVPFEERTARMVEILRICRAAWDGDAIDVHDRGYAIEGAVVRPRPYRRVPLLLGGTVSAAARRAGRIADGFVGTPVADAPPAERLARFRALVDEFDRGARAAGRDPRAMPIAFHMNAWVSPSGALEDDVRRAMWHQIGMYALWHARDEGRAVSDAIPPIDDGVLLRRTFLGTPSEVVAHARPWVDAFAGRDLQLIVRLHYPGMERAVAERAIRLFAAEVMPALRGPLA
jgi:probable F420-dependent oxidoreductase